MSLSLILTGPVQSKKGENKSEVEQAKVKIPHQACNELSNHQINNAERLGGSNEGHIRTIKSQQAALPYLKNNNNNCLTTFTSSALIQLTVGLMTHIHTISRQLALHRPWQPRPSVGEDVDHFNLTALNSF